MNIRIVGCGLLVAAVLLVSGCNLAKEMQQETAHANAVATDLKKAVGVKPLVGSSYNNGTFTEVTVDYQGIPSALSLQQVADLTREAVTKEFGQKPQQINVEFSIKP